MDIYYFCIQTIYIIMKSKLYILAVLMSYIPLTSQAQTNYTTIPGSIEDNPEKTWILKSIENNKNGKRKVSTHIITNFYSESVQACGLDCVDLRAPVITEDGNIDFNHFIFRESDDTVYRYNEDNNILCKSYDFTLTPSQQFERRDNAKYEVTECGIASDYAPYWSEYYPDRRMLRMHRLDAEGDDVWIEGVGSVHTGILLPIDFDSNEIYVQSMYHANHDCAFFSIDTDVFKSCPFKAEILETSDPIVEEIIQDQFNDNTTFDIEFVGDTLHVRGGLIAETRGTLKTLEAQIDNDEITLFVTEPTITRIMPGGTPIRFDVKIPGFNGGTYKIKYKDKNPVEVVCHDAVTSIEDQTASDIQRERYKSNAIYDLQGRRLKQVPERGIYIQDRKKVIK